MGLEPAITRLDEHLETHALSLEILNHLRDTGTTTATPRLRPSDATMTRRPFIDDFPAGYMQRMMPMLPKQGDRAPWLNTQSVSKDKKLIAQAPVDDGVMVFN